MNILDKKLRRFLLVCVSLYILWFLVYDLWLKPQGKVDFYLTHLLTENTISCLNLLGGSTYHGMQGKDHLIMGPHGKIIEISNACNGLVLYPLFIGFILAIPGKIKPMILVTLIGSALIYLVNVGRVVILSLIKIHAPEYLDFNHRYTFAIIVYAFIFFLWFVWINKFSILKGKLHESNA